MLRTGIHINVEKRDERSVPRSGQTCKAVQGALQYISGRHFVDDLRAPGARNIMSDERPRHDCGREPLIPEYDRQTGPLRQIVSESSRRLRAGTVASFEIERQPEDDTGDVELGEDRRQRIGVAGEGAARQGLQRRSKAALDVGDRKADRLGTKIDADQARLGGKALGEIFDRYRTVMAASGYHGAAIKSINGGRERAANSHAPAIAVCQQNTGDV